MRISHFAVSFCALFLLVVSPVEGQSRRTTRVLRSRPPAMATQPTTASHTITGIEAWSIARTNGFEFRPHASGDEWTTYPYDGVQTVLKAERLHSLAGLFQTDTVTVARVVGGNMTVDRPSSGSRTVTFTMFGGGRLSSGWTVEDVRLRGGTWKKRAEGNDLSIEVEATAYANRPATVRVESITLRGPAGQPWSAAFEGRRTWTISGIEAWATAKNYGYEFHPVVEYDDEVLRNGVDGTSSEVVQRDRPCSRAAGLVGKAVPFATVVGGNMIANCSHWAGEARDWSDNDPTRDFRMFAGKALAPGWAVRDVTVTGGSWVERPAPGSGSLAFVYRLTLPRGRVQSVTGIVTRVVLEGPASASSWQDAFKGN